MIKPLFTMLIIFVLSTQYCFAVNEKDIVTLLGKDINVLKTLNYEEYPCVDEEGDGGCTKNEELEIKTWFINNPNALKHYLFSEKGKIKSIWIVDKKYKTNKGFGIGDTYKDVLSSFPSANFTNDYENVKIENMIITFKTLPLKRYENVVDESTGLRKYMFNGYPKELVESLEISLIEYRQ